MSGLDSPFLYYGLLTAVLSVFLYLLIGWLQWRRWGRWRVSRDAATQREMRATFILFWFRIIPDLKKDIARVGDPSPDPIFFRPARMRTTQRSAWPRWLTWSRWFGGERRGYDRRPIRRPRSAWLDGDV